MRALNLIPSVALALAALLCACPAQAQSKTRNVPVLRAEFPDCPFSTDGAGTLEMISSAQEYFNSQCSPALSFNFEPGPVVTLEHEVAWYGANSTDRKDARLCKAVEEACRASGLDFKRFDNNSDGKADNVCILFAGRSESSGAGEDCITPQQNSLSALGAAFGVGGVLIDSFSVSTEADGIGGICHEFAHSLGLPDFYDTDGPLSGGECAALLGSTSLMDKGNLNGDGAVPPYLNALERELLGVQEGTPLEKGRCTLRPMGTEGAEFLRLDTATEGEYFLLECRASEGRDALIGGGGLLVYHVDKSQSPAGWSDWYNMELTAYERWEKNELNCNPAHQCAYILGEGFFPQNGSTGLGSDTNPSFTDWSGRPMSLAITGITRATDGSVSFNVLEPVELAVKTVFQDAAIIQWSADESIMASGFTVSWKADGSLEEEQSVELPQDRSFLTIEGLSPGTDYEVTVRANAGPDAGYRASAAFRTKVWKEGYMPYIYLSSAERSADGAFVKGSRIPLRLYNCPEAVEVKWTLDGIRIHTGEDGWYTIEEGGTLRAEADLSDGSTTIFTKQIRMTE